jgi:hypothetical protein
MKKMLLLSIIFLISLVSNGCIHRAPSLRMLEERADYDGKEKAEAEDLRLGDNQALSEVINGVPVRTPAKTANIWIFPEEMPNKAQFWGAWISVEVDGGRWEIQRTNSRAPEKPQAAKHKAISKVKK